MATAKYWRLLITENNGDPTYVTVAELEMFDTIGGTDLCTGGTATAHAFANGSNTPAFAFDNNLTNKWSGQVGGFTEYWIQYEFPTDVEVVSYSIVGCIGGQETMSPRLWTLQHSDDGNTWFDAHETPEPDEDWVGGERRVYTVGDKTTRIDYNHTYLQNRESSFQGEVNNDVRYTRTHTQFAGWDTNDGDMVQCTLAAGKNIAFARVYFIDGTGASAVNRPTTMYAKANGSTFNADLTGAADVNVGPGYSNWGDVIYVDIPINEITSEVIIGFQTTRWQMLLEIDLYESPASYEVSGKTTRGHNVPCSRQIFVHSQVTGVISGSGVSDPITGEFTIPVSSADSMFIRAVDPEGLYNSVLRENVIPTTLIDV